MSSSSPDTVSQIDEPSLFPADAFESVVMPSDVTPEYAPAATGPAKSSLAFRTISEVAHDINVPQHVLRFWESRFAQIKPLKRAGGRRYYRPEDVELLSRIKNYLYNQGYTIKGVQRLLKETRSMRQTAAAPAQKSFIPYAHPLASLPGHIVPPLSPVMKQSSLLSAASAAPSALAMAYGAVSSTILEEGKQIKAFEQQAAAFADAFSEATANTIEKTEQDTSATQLQSSLEAVTEIRDQIAYPTTPARIDTDPAVMKAMPAIEIEADAVMPEPVAEPVLEAAPVEPAQVVEAPASNANQAELKALLAELVELRQLLASNTGI